MKKYPLLFIAFLLLPFLSFSQGIMFEQGSWSEVLAVAKKTNKPVFVDVFATWCGPCKTMSNEVFPLQKVGDVYNKAFVCYKIDAEKGEGIELAKKYNVTAYPTYLFVRADGSLISRSLGSMSAENFIDVAKKVLLELDDPKPLAVWEAEYPKKKNDPTFVLEYLNKRSTLGLPVNAQFDAYLQSIPAAERLSERVVNLYKREGEQLVVTDYAFQHLLTNRAAFLAGGFSSVDAVLKGGIQNSAKEAGRSKNEALLEKAVAAIGKLPPSYGLTKEEVYMNYYQRTNEQDKFLKYATLHCNNLMTIDPASISAKNKTKQQLLDRMVELNGIMPLEFPETDTERLEAFRKSVEQTERLALSRALNSTAWTVFLTVTDVAGLKDALRWSDRSLELDPKNDAYLDTNANLLYKLGRKEEAIKQEKLAKSYAANLQYDDVIKKMEAGEKTW